MHAFPYTAANCVFFHILGKLIALITDDFAQIIPLILCEDHGIPLSYIFVLLAESETLQL